MSGAQVDKIWSRRELTASYLAHVRSRDRGVQTLEAHLSDVGKLAAQFASKLEVGDAGRLLGLLHDFGKYSHAFQNYIKSAQGILNPDIDEDYVDASRLKGKIDHSSAGAQYLWGRWKNIGANGQGELCGQILALCIASHHSGLIDCLDVDGGYRFWKRMEKADQYTNLTECMHSADVNLLAEIDSLLQPAVVKSIFGRLQQVVSMPRDSSETLSKIDAFTLGMFTRFLFSCLIDADRLNSAEFENPYRKQRREAQQRCFEWDMAIARFETCNAQFQETRPIDRIRRDISDHCLRRATDQQGIYTLTVPTGGG